MPKRKSVKKSHLRLTGEDYMNKVVRSNGGEDNDCVIRATATAMDIPYWQSHRFYSKHGRKLKSGTPVSEILGRKSRVLFGHRIGKRISTSRTVDKFVRQHPTGTFICCTHNHAFCVKGGKSGTRGNSIIKYYWRVTKIEKKPENFHAVIPQELYEPPKERSIFDVHRERIRQQNAKMPEPMRVV